MGRKKIEIKRLSDDRNRNVTFLKRKAGLMKKAWELSVLCSAEVAVIVFGHSNKLYEFSSSNVDDLLIRYTEYKGPIEHKHPSEFALAAAGDDPHFESEDEEDTGEKGTRSTSTAKGKKAPAAAKKRELTRSPSTRPNPAKSVSPRVVRSLLPSVVNQRPANDNVSSSRVPTHFSQQPPFPHDYYSNTQTTLPQQWQDQAHAAPDLKLNMDNVGSAQHSTLMGDMSNINHANANPNMFRSSLPQPPSTSGDNLSRTGHHLQPPNPYDHSALSPSSQFSFYLNQPSPYPNTSSFNNPPDPLYSAMSLLGRGGGGAGPSQAQQNGHPYPHQQQPNPYQQMNQYRSMVPSSLSFANTNHQQYQGQHPLYSHPMLLAAAAAAAQSSPHSAPPHQLHQQQGHPTMNWPVTSQPAPSGEEGSKASEPFYSNGVLLSSNLPNRPIRSPPQTYASSRPNASPLENQGEEQQIAHSRQHSLALGSDRNESASPMSENPGEEESGQDDDSGGERTGDKRKRVG